MVLGTQDKAKARRLKAELLSVATCFLSSDDLGDRADRIGPDLANALLELAELEGWTASKASSPYIRPSAKEDA